MSNLLYLFNCVVFSYMYFKFDFFHLFIHFLFISSLFPHIFIVSFGSNGPPYRLS